MTDFIVAGGLVAAVGTTLGLAARMTLDRAYRAAVGLALGAAFILVWANLAVGIIGSEDNASVVAMVEGKTAPQPPRPGSSTFGPGCQVGRAD